MAEEVSNSVGEPTGLSAAEETAGSNMQIIFYAANREEWEWAEEKLGFAGENYNKDIGHALPMSRLIDKWPKEQRGG